MSWPPGLPVPTFCFLVVSLPCSFSLSVSLLSQYMCTHVCLFQGRVSSGSTCTPDLYNWSCHQFSHLRTTVRFLSATWGWRNPSVDARCCTNSVIPPNTRTNTHNPDKDKRKRMDGWMDGCFQSLETLRDYSGDKYMDLSACFLIPQNSFMNLFTSSAHLLSIFFSS